MPTTLLTPQTLESVLQGLHESEIRCGIQNEPPAECPPAAGATDGPRNAAGSGNAPAAATPLKPKRQRPAQVAHQTM
jgi:hypothetical protein